jgi:2-polyprenyl-6-methoxyphenol hydroxylase-like FAD-dependent oxidoreductase
VLDRGRYGTDTLSTHALMRGAVLQLSRWGLIDGIVAAGTPPVHRTTFRYADEEVVVAVKPADGVDALYAPRRTILDALLVDAAVAAGAEIRFGSTVTGVLRDPTGRVEGIVGRGADGQHIEQRGRYLIGADGLRSTVASKVGAPLERTGAGTSSTTYGYWKGLVTDGYEWNFRPNAICGVIPTNHGEACVFASASPRRVGRGGLEVLRRIVELSSPQLADRLDAACPPDAARTFVGQRGHVRRAWGAGWALVGDAGYFKDPLSAHGLTDALRDAELLADAVVAALDGGPDGEAFLGYQTQRDALSTALFDVVDTIAGHRWTNAEIGSLLLQLSAAMADEVSALAARPRWTHRTLTAGHAVLIPVGGSTDG